MSFLLDTNICSVYLKTQGCLAHYFLQYNGGLFISTVALGELTTWAYRRADSGKLLRSIRDDLLIDIQILAYEEDAAWLFGKLRAGMLNSGIVVNPVDLMIAAIAIQHDLTLVTHNTKHFNAVPGLRIVDWLEP